MNYGKYTKYIGCGIKFRDPPICPECLVHQQESSDDWYRNSEPHRIDYISDYLTHRVGYHNSSLYFVGIDLENILEKEQKPKFEFVVRYS